MPSGQRAVLRVCPNVAPQWLSVETVGQGDAPAPPDPADLAAAARDRLVLPRVVVRVSPVGEQLVGLPTWLWVDASSWRPVSRSVSVPGASVKATATPESVTWSTGDGATVVCPGPGTPYTAAAAPEAASPDCGHVYRDVSPEGGFTVSATVRWRVAWSGAGRSGVFPGLARTESVAVRVAQAPAVNVTPDGGS
ncbi:hypothetical protein [Pseudonocardia sp.]|uniref:hypothetical protein n=1 Tax=Pseudonocardia sp. TaxID=60912 RepID=UPI003D0F8DEC